MQKHSRAGWMLPLMLLLLILCGCGAKTDTSMTLDEAFSGSRVIRCTVSKNDLGKKITGGEPALDSLLTQSCPDQLSWDKSSTMTELTYTFTLSFSNREDYLQKVSALLGRQPVVYFAAPNSIFSRGLHLKEDFSSTDLLDWARRAAVQQGILGEDTPLWEGGSTVLHYGDQQIITGETIELVSIEYFPVDKISIDTRLENKGRFQRTVRFQIPQSTCNQLADKLEPYMQARVPEGGAGLWETVPTGKTFTITFSAASPQELTQKTGQALDSVASAQLDSQNTTLFSKRLAYEETLDLSSFASNQNGKTFLEYSFSTDSEAGISGAQVLGSNGWVQMDGFLTKNGGFSFSNDTDTLSIRLKSENEYTISNVAIRMVHQEDGQFHRELILDFNGTHSNLGAAQAAEYFQDKKLACVQAEAAYSRCTVAITGTLEQMNAALLNLFGSGNAVTLTEETGFQLYYRDSVEDSINLTGFLSQIGYTGGQVSYTYSASRNLSSFLQQNQGDSEAQAFRAEGSSVSRTLPTSGQTVMTAACRTLNGWFLALLLVAGGAIIALLSWVGVLLWRRHRRRLGYVEPEEIRLPTEDMTFMKLDVRCPECDAPLYDGMHFCVKCGAPIFYTNPEMIEEEVQK